MKIKVIEPEEFEKKIRTPGIHIIEIGIYGLDRKKVVLTVDQLTNGKYGHRIRIPIEEKLFYGHNGIHGFERIFINDRAYYLGNVEKSIELGETNLSYICYDAISVDNE